MTTKLHIEYDLLRSTASLLSDYAHSSYTVISNQSVSELYLQRLQQQLDQRPFSLLQVADGEAHKNLVSYQTIISHLIEQRVDRSGCIIALGGGVITDMAGFAAATYCRGIDLINVPTTLLAQVDASVGNKTAINYAGLKNNIGAFYPALATWIDTACLDSLDTRQWSNGMAEVIKAACITDVDFFSWLENNHAQLEQRQPQAVTTMVQRAIAIKTRIVEQDSHEKGLRRILNFGHSIGHALESMSQFQDLLHGEAVSIGMSLAATLSTKLCQLDAGALQRIQQLLTQWQLPTTLPSGTRITDLTPALQHDKKISHSQIKMVLLDSLGLSKICPMTIEQLTTELQNL